MARERKRDTFDLRAFLHKIMDGMSCQELIESGIIRCVSADRIYDAMTPELQRKKAVIGFVTGSHKGLRPLGTIGPANHESVFIDGL